MARSAKPDMMSLSEFGFGDLSFNDAAWSLQFRIVNDAAGVLEAGVVPLVVPAMNSEGRQDPIMGPTVQSCPSCGMSREDWPNPEGYVKKGRTYCCQGCADGTGCTCKSGQEPR